MIPSLRQRNYRLFFFGQLVSVAGTWMQTVAQSFLVLDLTHSGTQLGLVTAARFLPMFAFGPLGHAQRYTTAALPTKLQPAAEAEAALAVATAPTSEFTTTPPPA